MTSSKGPTVLALDVGTSSIRALLFDADAHPVTEAIVKVPHRATLHPGNGATFDADVLLKRVYGAIDAVAARAPDAFERVAGVGVSTFWHSMVGIDGAGETVTPLYLWVDMRSAPDAATLRSELGAEVTRNRTGCPLHAAYLPAKLRWLGRTEPATFAKCRSFVSVGELLALRLHGQRAVSPAMASGSGLFDLRSVGWDEPVLRAVGVKAGQLSEIASADHALVGLVPEFAARWPRLAEVPWALAVGDGATSNLGTAGVGGRRANRVVAMVGTSAAARAFLEGPPSSPLPRGLWAYRMSPGRTLTGGALGSGGNLVQWVMETYKLSSLADAESEIAWALDASNEVGPLTFLPFLAGERSMGWNDAARGVFANVSFNATPVDFLRAALESVAFGIADVVDALGPLATGAGVGAGAGAPPDVIASGAALIKSPVWIQILADVLGRPVLRSPWKEASSRGAAMLALVAGGVVRDLGDVPALATEPVAPSMTRHARYAEARARWRDLYRRIYGDADSGAGSTDA